MKHSRKITFVYFDIGGVILRWKEMFDHLAQLHGKSRKEIEQVFEIHDIPAEKGKIGVDHLWERMAHDLSIPAWQQFEPMHMLTEKFSPIGITHEFLKETIQVLPVGLLTNIYSGVYEHSVKRGHIPDLAYTAVVQSCDIGFMKPEKEIYQHAQRLAKVPHNQILFIDDLEVNIEAARSVGWQGIVFDTDNPEYSIEEIRRILAA